MLVLSRKRKEAIQIGKDITIYICSIGHGSVKIGIDAPKKIDIKRKEIESVEDEDDFM
jgi:carbon storage regulator